MARATQAAFDALAGAGFGRAPVAQRVAAGTIRLSMHDDLATLAHEWRAFQQIADGTAFQSYEWLTTWQRCIGALTGARPVIVAGRDTGGALVFLLPLAVEPARSGRRLTWLGSKLNDYNGPLLAPDFSRQVDAAQFAALWRETLTLLQSRAELRFDVLHLDKMPEQIGGQRNPFLALGTHLNPSGAYRTRLGADWDAFYAEKRSSTTRRRDRTKRKKLAEFGALKFVTAGAPDMPRTLDALFAYKAQAFAAMGIPDVFARPGHHQFFLELATQDASRAMVHVSRLDSNDTPAAVNYGLMFRGVYYHVLASYTRGDISRFGPGAAHLHDVMRYAIEHKCNVFDFTIGDEPYKRDWSDTELPLYDHISAASPRGALDVGMLRALASVKRWIKQTPTLWNAYTKVRVWVGPLRRCR